jgi:hypothetical protein
MSLFPDLILGFAILGVVFVSSHRKHAHDFPSKLSHNIHLSTYSLLLISSFGQLGAYVFPFHYPSVASYYVYSWHLLYLSLDGVIAEASIYVYIPYNMRCVSSVYVAT